MVGLVIRLPNKTRPSLKTNLVFFIDKCFIFDKFILMQLNVSALEKKAITSALNQDWEEAIKVNGEILEKIPDDRDASIRLGRALLMNKDYAKAKKIFKQILDADPINKIAQKNYKLAAEKKDDVAGKDIAKLTKAYIKEPGTTVQIELKTEKKYLKSLEIGQELGLRINKTKLNFIDTEKDRDLGEIKDETSVIVFKAKQDNKHVTAKVIKIKDESVVIALQSKFPIFRSEKQIEKPFMKRDVLDEPELDVTETESIDIEEE